MIEKLVEDPMKKGSDNNKNVYLLLLAFNLSFLTILMPILESLFFKLNF